MTGAPTDGPGAEGRAPARVWNRPGLPALAYRVGTHREFLDAMLARLSPAGDRTPLAALTTREPDDPSIALLDAWAVVADVLTFYQERIANEGFLRTATEQESLTRLGRLVGHRPRPALAATAHLAYTLDPGTSCVVPAGSQVRKEPEPGGVPAVFETSVDLAARAEWNTLPVRTTLPTALTPDVAPVIASVDVDGTQSALRPGDRLLFTFPDARLNLTRLVTGVERDPVRGRTAVRLRVPDPPRQLDNAVEALREDMEEAAERASARGPFEDLLEMVRDVRQRAEELRDPDTLAARLDRGLRRLRERLSGLGDDVDADALAERAAVRLATVEDAVRRLAEEPPPAAPAGEEALLRDLGGPGGRVVHAVDPLLYALGPVAPPPRQAPAVTDALGAGSDALPRLLAGNRTGLTASLYRALSAVSLPATAPPGVRHFRVTATPLGASIPDDDRVRRLLRASRSEGGGPLANDVLLLDAVHEAIQPGSWIAVQVAGRIRVRVIRVVEVGRLSVANDQDALRVTRLRLAEPWTDDCEDVPVRRATTVWAAGEPLVLAPSPDTTDLAGDTVPLDGVFEGLAPGRLVAVSGERTDVVPEDGTTTGRRTGVPGSELAVLRGVRHAFDGTSCDDRVRTTLLLTAPLAHRYRRDTVVVHGNVVPATAGETVTEVLGSGDATRAGQVLPLRRGPLVWLPSVSADGGEEALTVRVDDVAWRRTVDLSEAGPTERVFGLRAGPDGRAAVEFGDGRNGARLPSGTENVTARYRVGGGRAGNAAAGRINQVVSRPLGVSGVTNPLPASGGADADGPAELRRSIPLRPAALDRLVSVRDFQSFARAFAGVGKAVARRCVDGGRPVLHVTVAAADDAPLDAASPLIAGLRAALRRYGDPALPVRVEPCERVRLVVALGVRTTPGHLPEKVERRVREALADRLGFAGAHLGHPVYLSAVVAAAHAVPGVDFVDVDAFGGVPEGADPASVVRFAEHPSVVACVPSLPAGPRMARAPVTSGDGAPGGAPDPAALVDAAQAPTVLLRHPVAVPPAGDRAAGPPPRPVMRPAQLVLLDPAVPGTLILRRMP
ncbi:putative baseplate assembly protein [Streptomyces sp. NPDC007945]|uniref:putative baseplate assembly protein n=1 Tax=Streptomyces sp. NPDC007945 TaxID=3364797 RepID=UPI0036E65933